LQTIWRKVFQPSFLNFDGVDDFATINIDSLPERWTIEFLGRFDVLNGMFFRKGNVISLSVIEDPVIQVGYIVGRVQYADPTEMNHYAITYEDEVVSLFVNAEKRFESVCSFSQEEVAALEGPDTFFFFDDMLFKYPGAMGFFRVWNTVLNEEILSDYMHMNITEHENLMISVSALRDGEFKNHFSDTFNMNGCWIEQVDYELRTKHLVPDFIVLNDLSQLNDYLIFDWQYPEGTPKKFKEGYNSFKIKARDFAGNWSETAVHTMLVDTVPALSSLVGFTPEGELITFSLQSEESTLENERSTSNDVSGLSRVDFFTKYFGQPETLANSLDIEGLESLSEFTTVCKDLEEIRFVTFDIAGNISTVKYTVSYYGDSIPVIEIVYRSYEEGIQVQLSYDMVLNNVDTIVVHIDDCEEPTLEVSDVIEENLSVEDRVEIIGEVADSFEMELRIFLKKES